MSENIFEINAAIRKLINKNDFAGAAARALIAYGKTLRRSDPSAYEYERISLFGQQEQCPDCEEWYDIEEPQVMEHIEASPGHYKEKIGRFNVHRVRKRLLVIRRVVEQGLNVTDEEWLLAYNARDQLKYFGKTGEWVLATFHIGVWLTLKIMRHHIDIIYGKAPLFFSIGLRIIRRRPIDPQTNSSHS